MIEERTGEAFEFDEQLTVVGGKLRPGDNAPQFELDYFDSENEQMKTLRLSDSAGSVRLLSVVNSLDTPVCHVETRRFEDSRPDLLQDVQLYTIGMDLPFAQARWHPQEDVSHRSLSSHRSEQFGRDYGVLLKEWRLLQKAVFVVDKNDRTVLYLHRERWQGGYGYCHGQHQGQVAKGLGGTRRTTSREAYRGPGQKQKPWPFPLLLWVA